VAAFQLPLEEIFEVESEVEEDDVESEVEGDKVEVVDEVESEVKATKLSDMHLHRCSVFNGGSSRHHLLGRKDLV